MFSGGSTVSTNFPGQPNFTSGSGMLGTPLIIFIVFMALAFSGLATFLIVSAVRRPRLIVFNVAQRALFMEYGCKGPEVSKISWYDQNSAIFLRNNIAILFLVIRGIVRLCFKSVRICFLVLILQYYLQVVDFEELGAPYIIVNNNQKHKHRLHFDLRIPRLNGESDIAIELTSIDAHFKSFNGVSPQTEKLTRDLIEIAAKVCHIFRFVKRSNEPVSIPLRLQFNLADLD